jgi:hypothetical protein
MLHAGSRVARTLLSLERLDKERIKVCALPHIGKILGVLRPTVDTSQLVFDAHDRIAQFLSTIARSG